MYYMHLLWGGLTLFAITDTKQLPTLQNCYTDILTENVLRILNELPFQSLPCLEPFICKDPFAHR